MIFQYQQLAQPFITGSDPVALGPLAWLPRFPDQVPHRRTQIWTQPSSVAPFIISSASPVRVTQAPVEVLTQYATGSRLTRLTQAPVETIFAYAVAIRQVRVTQAAVEIVYPFGCHVYVPPLPAPCPVPNPEEDSGSACPAPVLGGGD